MSKPIREEIGITVRFVKPLRRRYVRQDAAAGEVKWRKGEQLSGVPFPYVLERWTGPCEVFDLLLGNGTMVLRIPYAAVEIV